MEGYQDESNAWSRLVMLGFLGGVSGGTRFTGSGTFWTKWQGLSVYNGIGPFNIQVPTQLIKVQTWAGVVRGMKDRRETQNP